MGKFKRGMNMRMITYFHRLGISLILAGLSLSCALHYVRVDSDTRLRGGPKKDVQTAVKLVTHFPNQSVDPAPDKDPRFEQSALRVLLQNSPLFRLQEHAGLVLDFTVGPLENDYEALKYLWCLSLGVAPAFGSSPAKVSFQLKARDSGKVLKNYSYSIEHRAFLSWWFLPFAPLVGVSQNFVVSPPENLMIYEPLKLVFERFEREFNQDLNDPQFVRNIKRNNRLQPPETYLLMGRLGPRLAAQDFSFRVVHSKLERKLRSRGARLVLAQSDIKTSPRRFKPGEHPDISRLAALGKTRGARFVLLYDLVLWRKAQSGAGDEKQLSVTLVDVKSKRVLFRDQVLYRTYPEEKWSSDFTVFLNRLFAGL